MWVKIVLVCALLIVISCDRTTTNPEDLIVGKWQLVSIDAIPVKTNEGLQFAPNRQYFRMDSQGKPIFKLMEKIWSIDGDTLTLIDYNWEPDFIDKKGTQIFLLNSISDEELDITIINKKEKRFIYKAIQ
jgi:hypothetical protein